MKTQKKTTPALLGDPAQPKQYQVQVEFSNNRWAVMTFSERDMAEIEYNRIRSSSIYCNAWVDSVTLTEKEIKNETMA
jgi:hypothetical protein